MSSLPFRKRSLLLLALPLLAIPFAARGKSARGGDSNSPPTPTEVIHAETAQAAIPVAPAAQQPAGPSACPAGMVLVEGMSCSNPKQDCEQWIDNPDEFPYARCGKFKSPATCDGSRTPMRFCMDKEEYTAKGEELPTGDVSWNDAKKTCESQGKRLCGEQEWTFACEGEEMRPYPYGFERDPSVCNFEQGHLTTPDGKLRDGRVPESSNQQCLSPFGVHNMVGNIDEWVVLEKPHYSQRAGGRKMMSGLKGGWWGPLRNRCRPVTVDHDEVFHELQTGIRCCADSLGKNAEAVHPAALQHASHERHEDHAVRRRVLHQPLRVHLLRGAEGEERPLRFRAGRAAERRAEDDGVRRQERHLARPRADPW